MACAKIEAFVQIYPQAFIFIIGFEELFDVTIHYCMHVVSVICRQIFWKGMKDAKKIVPHKPHIPLALLMYGYFCFWCFYHISFLLACYTTLHPAMFVGWLFGWLVGRSVGPLFTFWAFLSFLSFLSYCPCPNVLVTFFSNAPAHRARLG